MITRENNPDDRPATKKEQLEFIKKILRISEDSIVSYCDGNAETVKSADLDPKEVWKHVMGEEYKDD